MQPMLTIHLDAIAENYRRLAEQFSGGQVGAVVKADAYGLGAVEVAKLLIKQRCPILFVATLEEAIGLKSTLAEELEAKKLPPIAVFHGPYKGQEEEFITQGFIPVINYISQLERWMLKSHPAPQAPYILHIDTGMCRLGLNVSDMEWLAEHGQDLLARKPIYLMSHLACANRKEHPKNAEQLALFKSVQPLFSDVPTSFCNSSGIYLDRIFHGDLARPGSALYGINPAPWMGENPMQHVADLTAPIIMLRELDAEETIGYGATASLPAKSRTATIQMGYADGLLRCLSNTGIVFISGVPCPIVGRVSMDMIIVDVTHLPEAELHHYHHVSIICPEQPVDTLAKQADTIGYEVFTRLGSRVKRVYV